MGTISLLSTGNSNIKHTRAKERSTSKDLHNIHITVPVVSWSWKSTRSNAPCTTIPHSCYIAISLWENLLFRMLSFIYLARDSFLLDSELFFVLLACHIRNPDCSVPREKRRAGRRPDQENLFLRDLFVVVVRRMRRPTPTSSILEREQVDTLVVTTKCINRSTHRFWIPRCR